MDLDDRHGVFVTEEMREILARNKGFIKTDDGGQRIADLYVQGSFKFNSKQCSPFGQACFWGFFEQVKYMVESGASPDLSGTETPYQLGYASLVVLGSERVTEAPRGGKQWSEILSFLLSKGMPPDVEDIMGYTALDHATMSSRRKLDLARYLLTSPHSGGAANVNHQNRRGIVPICGPMMHDMVDAVDLLLEFGADLNIPDADGVAPSKIYVSCGPRVTATVQKWLRKRSGEDDLTDLKKCGNPQCQPVNATSSGVRVELKLCSRCKATRYCSSTCQRAHWSQHKTTCVPFDASAPTTVTLKPFYNNNMEFMSLSTTVRNLQGIPTDSQANSSFSMNIPKQVSGKKAKPKQLVIKVQVAEGSGPMLVYTRKRDFVCMVHKHENVSQYDRIVDVVKTKGVMGRKAYFAAELQSKDVLVVKIDSVLAEQPF